MSKQMRHDGGMVQKHASVWKGVTSLCGQEGVVRKGRSFYGYASAFIGYGFRDEEQLAVFREEEERCERLFGKYVRWVVWGIFCQRRHARDGTRADGVDGLGDGGIDDGR